MSKSSLWSQGKVEIHHPEGKRTNYSLYKNKQAIVNNTVLGKRDKKEEDTDSCQLSARGYRGAFISKMDEGPRFNESKNTKTKRNITKKNVTPEKGNIDL